MGLGITPSHASTTPAKLPAQHNAAVAACDRLDRLADGHIDDPRACRFDPAAVGYPVGTDHPTCLTPAQVAAARKLYAGPTDAHGRRLYPGGQTPGSELAWAGWIIPLAELGNVSFVGELADNYLRYIGYPIGRPHSSLADFQVTVGEFDRLTPEGVKTNALSLDLARFRRSGGKLIIWHGWPTRRSRPPGPSTQRDGQGNLVGSRPVFPYPLRARYDGTGSVDDASNFVAAPPAVPPHDVIHWVGNDLYAKPGTSSAIAWRSGPHGGPPP